jgi:hypothetical protein
MPDTHPAPGRIRKSSKPGTKPGAAEFLGRPWWQGVGAIVGVAALVVAVLALVPSGQQSSISSISAVVTTDGDGATDAYAGPSTHGYYIKKTINANAVVHVICTVYGEPYPSGAKNALWDYTDLGWLNDHFISTGAKGPTAPGCTGTASMPRAGTNIPTKPSGPYAVIADEGRRVPVRIQPTLTAPTTGGGLVPGTFVRLRCTIKRGPDIAAPRALGPAGSNNVWDRIVDPDGWVPDSYVATYSGEPIAPSCS